MPTDEEFMSALRMQVIHGQIVPIADVIHPDHIEQTLNYSTKDGDTVLVAYPKTGSTWLLYIIWEILHKGEEYHSVEDTYQKYAPCIEVTGSGPVEALPPPRFYKRHISFAAIPPNPNAKYIYLHRRPEDLVVSFYHFNKYYVEKDYEFDFFYEAFISGTMWYGDYYDHVLAAYKHKDEKNFLFVTYEDLRFNTRAEILRIAEFLGEEYSNELKTDEDLLQKIMQVTAFDHMKKSLSFDIPVDKEVVKEAEPFFRKGVVGDGQERLTTEQMERLNSKTKEKMTGTEVEQHWLAEIPKDAKEGEDAQEKKA